MIDTKSFRRTQNRPHIARDNFIIVLPRTGHAISGHIGFNDHGPQLLPEIIGLGPRPAKEVANAVVAFKGVKAPDGLFEAVERCIKVALPVAVQAFDPGLGAEDASDQDDISHLSMRAAIVEIGRNHAKPNSDF